MPARDSATGRFTSGGGGGGTQLGSAYGKIVLDPSGVVKAVGTANAALGAMQGHMGRAAGIMSGAFKVGAVALAGGLAAVVGGITAVTGSSVKMAAGLEAQMDVIQAVMNATTGEVAALEQKILDLGIDPTLKVSTLEAASAIEMLGRNGLNTTAILDGAAQATVLLANSTGAQFATAANIATDVMALFNINASDMQRAVDGVTATLNNSKFGVDDYALAIAQGGGVASVVGVSFEDFNTSIAAISPLFHSGSDAGTSYKVMLQRLAAPTEIAKSVMQELNLVTADGKNLFFDAQGNMKGMAEVAGLLQTATAGLTEEQRTQALTMIFGQDAIRAAAGLMRSGEVVYTDAAVAARELGVSIDEVNKVIDGGVTKFEALQLTMGETSAIDSAAIRMDNLAGSMEIFSGVIETLRIRIGKAFIPVVRGVVDTLTDVLSRNADRIVAFFQIIAAMFTGFISTIRSFFGSFSQAFNANFGAISQNAEGWGRNITISLARGIVAAAVAVVQALSYIGRIITGWLQPGSPPALLPNLDKWGTGAMDVYLGGFSQADFSVFDTISSTIEDYLRSIAPEDDEGLVPRIIGSREAIAAAIAQIRETGEVGAETFSQLLEITGPLPESISNYINALFELEAATQAVAAAQEDLDAIQGISLDTLAEADDMATMFSGNLLNAVDEYVGALYDLQAANEEVALAQQNLNDTTQQYSDALSPLNAEMKALRDREQEIRDAERIAELQEVLADEAASAADKEKAQLEIDQILLRQKIDALEEERDAAVGAAEDELAAAEEAAAAAEEEADLKRQLALEVAQAQLEAAEAQQQAAQDQLDMFQSTIEQQQHHNDLIEEQLSLLEQLAEEIGGVGGAIEDGLGGALDEALGDGLGGMFEDVGAEAGEALSAGLDEALGAGLGESVESVGDAFSEGIDQLVRDIQDEFAPLTAAGAELGSTWGETFTLLIGKFGEVSGFFQQHGTLIRDVVLGISSGLATFAILTKVVGWVATLAAVFLKAGGAIKAAGSVIGGIVTLLGGPIAVAVLALSALVTLFTIAWLRNWGNIREITQSVVGAISHTINSLIEIGRLLFTGDFRGGIFGLMEDDPIIGVLFRIRDTILDVVNRALQPLRNLSAWFSDNREIIQDFADNTIGRVIAKFNEVARDVGGFVVEQFNKVSDWFNENRPLIEKFVTTVSNFVGGILAKQLTRSALLLGALAAAFTFLASRAIERVLGLWAVIRPILSGVISLVLNLVTAIMQAVTGDWTAAWETLKKVPTIVWTALQGAFTAFLNWVTGWFGTSWQNVKAIWASNWEVLKTLPGLAFEAIKTAVASKLEEIRASIVARFEAAKTSVAETLLGLVTGVVAQFEEIRAGIEAKITAAREAALLLWEEIKAGILEKLRDLFEAMGLDFDEMVARWSAIWNDVKQIADAVWELIKAAVLEKAEAVRLFVEQKLLAVALFWQTQWTAIYTKLTEIWELIKTAVLEKAEAVRLFIEEKVNIIEAFWGERWDAISAKLSEIWETMKAAVLEKITSVKGTVETETDNIKSGWEERWTAVKDKLSEIWDQMKSAVSEKINEVYTTITNKVEEIQSWISGKVGTFYNLGRDLLGGMVDGVLSMAGNLISAATGAIEDAIAAAQALLGISSPSKVFRGFAVNSMTSFISGITDMAGPLQTAVSNAIRPSIGIAANYAGLLASGRPGAGAALADAARAATPAPVAGPSTTTNQQIFNVYGNIGIQGAQDPQGLLEQLRGFALGGGNV